MLAYQCILGLARLRGFFLSRSHYINTQSLVRLFVANQPPENFMVINLGLSGVLSYYPDNYCTNRSQTSSPVISANKRGYANMYLSHS